MKSRPAASILAQQGGSLLKFDCKRMIACIPDTTSPGTKRPYSHFRAKTETTLGCASRDSHPSEDLSELPPLRVAVARQEYQCWCCHRKTGRPRPAFWTNGSANHLPCRIDADCSAQVGHRAFSNVACQFSVSTWHTSGCISASGYVLEKVQDGLSVVAQKAPHYLS